MLKIAFAGTPEFAIPSLQALLNSQHTVCAVYTQLDKRAGRGRKLTGSPVKALALENDIPLFQPETLQDKTEQEMFAALNVDVLVVVAYGLLLPKRILTTPKYGCINVHASLLPRWRGAAPIQHALLAGDKETGITIMQMDEGLDTGPTLNRIICPIHSTDTFQTLYTNLAKVGSEALLIALSDVEAGRTHPKKQNEREACYAKKIKKQDAKINWNESAVQIERMIRAFYPWPMAFTEMHSRHIRVIRAAALNEKTTASPGSILRASKEGIDVATGKKILRLLELQFAGREPTSIVDILNARKEEFAPGKCFSDSEEG